MSESRAHYDNGIVWKPLPDFAREYNKSRDTVREWIDNGFIFRLGFTVKRDATGHWFIGMRQNPSSTENKTNTASPLSIH